jgi:acetyltransferase
MCHTFPYLERLGIGISQAISVGNMADIDIIDILKYLADDPRTEAIALYLEWIRKGREFIEFAKEITRRKPICALYVGGSEAGARASLSHTGALSGTDELYNGVFRQAGIIRAQTLEDLFDWTWALANQPLPKGRRMAILTNSGGPGVSMADACNKAGLEVPLLSEDTQKKIRNFIPSTASPKNPIDLTFMIDLRVSLDELARILLENSEVDGLLIYGIFGLAHLQRVLEISDEKFDVSMEKMGNFMMETITNFTKFPQIYGKPIIGCSFDSQGEKPVVLLQDGNIPFYPTPERAVKAMAALFQYARIRVRQEA